MFPPVITPEYLSAFHGFIDSRSLGIMALGLVEHRQVVQARGHVGVVGANVLLSNFEGFLGDNDGRPIFACPIKLFDLTIKDAPLYACTFCKHGRCRQQ